MLDDLMAYVSRKYCTRWEIAVVHSIPYSVTICICMFAFPATSQEIARFIRVLSNLSLCFTMTPYRATVAKILITPHQQTVIWYLFYTSVQCPLTVITDPQVRSPTYTVECSYNKIMLKALKEYQIFIQFRIHAFLWAIYSMRSTNLGILHGTLTFVIDCPI